MKEYRSQNEGVYNHAEVAANCLVPAFCGDFVFAGSIDSAANLLPTLAFADRLMADGSRGYFGT